MYVHLVCNWADGMPPFPPTMDFGRKYPCTPPNVNLRTAGRSFSPARPVVDPTTTTARVTSSASGSGSRRRQDSIERHQDCQQPDGGADDGDGLRAHAVAFAGRRRTTGSVAACDPGEHGGLHWASERGRLITGLLSPWGQFAGCWTMPLRSCPLVNPFLHILSDSPGRRGGRCSPRP